jgi:indolepyruvate ferredoxin oxidoreductase
MTGAFTRNPDLVFPGQRLRRALIDAAGEKQVDFVDASRLATKLTGDAIATNLFLVGYAWQKGLIPLSRAAIEQTIELNGVAVSLNQQAFLWGRRAAHDLAAVEAIVRASESPRPQTRTLDELIEDRAAFLTAYQDGAYAEQYRRTVTAVREAERSRVPGRSELTEAVARSLFRLMRYKDEYEVARLYTDGSFKKQLAAEFEAWDRLEIHLAPPLLAARDPTTGHLRKRRYGPWMLRAFGLVARLRRLRGTALDPFGWTAERRMERRLIGEFEGLLEEVMTRLAPENHALAVELAGLPERIRGFGHVKDANLAAAKAREAELLEHYRNGTAILQAAE